MVFWKKISSSSGSPLGPPSLKELKLPDKPTLEIPVEDVFKDTPKGEKEKPVKDNATLKKDASTSAESTAPSVEETVKNETPVKAYIIPATEDDLLLLARLIEAEAEAESFTGKIAVGAVVINRVLHHSFPNTIYEVIMEPDQFESVANWRLASIYQPSPESLQAAEEALLGTDPTYGALFFFNPQKTYNQWLRQKPVKLSLGNHLFVG